MMIRYENKIKITHTTTGAGCLFPGLREGRMTIRRVVEECMLTAEGG